MQLEAGWLHDEARRAVVRYQVERHLMRGAGRDRADRATPAHGDGPVMMAAHHALDVVKAAQHGGHGGAVAAVDAVHVGETGAERRMVHEDYRRPVGLL